MSNSDGSEDDWPEHPQPESLDYENMGNSVEGEHEDVTSENIEDYLCPVCMETFIDPVESDCHHRFCDFCLQHWFRTRGNKFCPVCRSDIQCVLMLQELKTSIETYLSGQLTSTQMEERKQTRASRISILAQPTIPADDDESVFGSRFLQEELFPGGIGTFDFGVDAETEIDYDFTFRSPRPPSRRGYRDRRSSIFPSLRHARYMVGHQNYETRRDRTPRLFNFGDENFTDDSDDDNLVGAAARMSRLNQFLSTIPPPTLTPTPRMSETQGSGGFNSDSQTELSWQQGSRNQGETLGHMEASHPPPTGSLMSEREGTPRYQPIYPPLPRPPPSTTHFETERRELSQHYLLREFHHRLSQAQLAYNAVVVAQVNLDQEGHQLREIYDECIRVGLMNRTEGGRPASAQSNIQTPWVGYPYADNMDYSQTPAPPGYGPPHFQPYTNNQDPSNGNSASPNYTNGQNANTPTPLTQFDPIWATYLSGNGVQNDLTPNNYYTWYQRVLHRQDVRSQNFVDTAQPSAMPRGASNSSSRAHTAESATEQNNNPIPNGYRSSNVPATPTSPAGYPPDLTWWSRTRPTHHLNPIPNNFWRRDGYTRPNSSEGGIRSFDLFNFDENQRRLQEALQRAYSTNTDSETSSEHHLHRSAHDGERIRQRSISPEYHDVLEADFEETDSDFDADETPEDQEEYEDDGEETVQEISVSYEINIHH